MNSQLWSSFVPWRSSGLLKCNNYHPELPQLFSFLKIRMRVNGRFEKLNFGELLCPFAKGRTVVKEIAKIITASNFQVFLNKKLGKLGRFDDDLC